MKYDECLPVLLWSMVLTEDYYHSDMMGMDPGCFGDG